MKKINKMLCSVAIIVFIVGLCVLYYYYPRKVSFELTKEIQKPNKEFDQSSFIGFDYADSEEMLMYWLVEWYKGFPDREYLHSYDLTFVQNLAKELDFERYDYIITYQKQLKALRHSPHLTKTEDGLYFDKKTPLIPTFDTVITDKIYIYRIKKNNKYRSFGP